MVKNIRGSSIVEVMVMMFIMTISIVGVYTVVNNGQRLAYSTDQRRIALSIAREGIEGVTNLRDTFDLRKYTADPECFFSLDASNYGECPTIDTVYALLPAPYRLESGGNVSVCIDSDGWYNQEKISDTENCSSTTPLCTGATATGCRTPYERRVTFLACDDIGLPSDQCLQIFVEVNWGTTNSTRVSLTQLITRHRK